MLSFNPEKPEVMPLAGPALTRCYNTPSLGQILNSSEWVNFLNVDISNLQKFIQLTLVCSNPNNQERSVATSSANFEYDPDGYHFEVPKGVSLQHAITRLKVIDPNGYATFLKNLNQDQIVRKEFDGNPVYDAGTGTLTLADILAELEINL